MHATTPGRTERVLVALDGSPAAATALPVAQTVARQLSATLELLHVGATLPPALAPDSEAVRVTLRPGDAATAILADE